MVALVFWRLINTAFGGTLEPFVSAAAQPLTAQKAVKAAYMQPQNSAALEHITADAGAHPRRAVDALEHITADAGVHPRRAVDAQVHCASRKTLVGFSQLRSPHRPLGRWGQRWKSDITIIMITYHVFIIILERYAAQRNAQRAFVCSVRQPINTRRL